MVEKKKLKKIGEALGISGFTLGIAGYFSLLFMTVLSLINKALYFFYACKATFNLLFHLNGRTIILIKFIIR